MNFKLYPGGSQTCNLDIASYAHREEDIKYVWRPNNPVTPDSKTLKDKYKTPLYEIYETPKLQDSGVTTSTGTQEAELII